MKKKKDGLFVTFLFVSGTANKWISFLNMLGVEAALG